MTPIHTVERYQHLLQNDMKKAFDELLFAEIQNADSSRMAWRITHNFRGEWTHTIFSLDETLTEFFLQGFIKNYVNRHHFEMKFLSQELTCKKCYHECIRNEQRFDNAFP